MKTDLPVIDAEPRNGMEEQEDDDFSRIDHVPPADELQDAMLDHATEIVSAALLGGSR